MHLLADEHIPLTSIRILRASDHNVLSVAADFPSIEDIEIVEIARREGRIIVTCDSDFGELIFKDRVERPSGVVYFRINRFKSDEPARIILRHLAEGTVFEGSFTVITRSRIRQKFL